VFGPALGTERQTQMVLAVLLVCISLEIAGDPYKLVDESFRILGRLEIASLFVQWSTMWGGSMIFASQDKESEGFVMVLSIAIAFANIVLLAWSFKLFVVAYKSESDAEKARLLEEELAANGGTVVQRATLFEIVHDKKRWVQSRLSSKATTQKRLRSRTVSSKNLTNHTNVNPLEGIEMSTIQINHNNSDDRNENGGGEDGAARVGETTSAGMQPPPAAPTRRDQQRDCLPESLLAARSSDPSEMLRKKIRNTGTKKKKAEVNDVIGSDHTKPLTSNVNPMLQKKKHKMKDKKREEKKTFAKDTLPASDASTYLKNEWMMLVYEQTYGPYSIKDLELWLKEESIEPDAIVNNGGDWITVSEVVAPFLGNNESYE